MTTMEIKNLAKWTAELWRQYQLTMTSKMENEDFDKLVEELNRIWEESGKDELIFGIAAAMVDDIERRTK